MLCSVCEQGGDESGKPHTTITHFTPISNRHELHLLGCNSAAQCTLLVASDLWVQMTAFNHLQQLPETLTTPPTLGCMQGGWPHVSSQQLAYKQSQHQDTVYMRCSACM